MSQHAFDKHARDAVYRTIFERRDMRHFIPGSIEPEVLERLLKAAHAAPSVGFMQPWRFIRISKSSLRARIHQLVEQERVHTAKALGEREDEFMHLKVEGIRGCSELIVVALMDKRESHIFGRRTLPDMDLASSACAIQNMWLAARAEGLGLGWVSLFDPEQLARTLLMPEGSKPIAILCIGHVDEFYPEPMLAIEGWAKRGELSDYVMENAWSEETASSKAD
jgi:5,6-dimethylbenzimidazole synthase